MLLLCNKIQCLTNNDINIYHDILIKEARSKVKFLKVVPMPPGLISILHLNIMVDIETSYHHMSRK